MLKDFVEVGKLGKPFGVSGKLKLIVPDEILDVIQKSKVVFLKRGGHHIPFFIEYIEESHDTLVKIEEIDDPQSAKNCSGSLLFLPIKDMPKIKEQPGLYFSILKGFILLNQDEIEIGVIEDVISMPQQELAQIMTKAQQEILIPLHESLIIDIDPDRKVVKMEIVDGLTDL